MKRFSLLLMMLMMSISIFAKGELKTVVYTTNPVMHCQNCENKIKNELKFVKGIKKIETSVENQTVTITYDEAKTSPEKIEKAFSNIKYKVKRVEGKAGCGKHEGCAMHQGCANHEGCGKHEGCQKEGDCCKEKK